VALCTTECPLCSTGSIGHTILLILDYFNYFIRKNNPIASSHPCVCPFPTNLQINERIFMKLGQHNMLIECTPPFYFQFLRIKNTNMAVMRTSTVDATHAPLNKRS
jgi:hypothetical protein